MASTRRLSSTLEMTSTKQPASRRGSERRPADRRGSGYSSGASRRPSIDPSRLIPMDKSVPSLFYDPIPDSSPIGLRTSVVPVISMSSLSVQETSCLVSTTIVFRDTRVPDSSPLPQDPTRDPGTTLSASSSKSPPCFHLLPPKPSQQAWSASQGSCPHRSRNRACNCRTPKEMRLLRHFRVPGNACVQDPR
jgi:hypothetical protein